jgi:hypothetical protein
VRGRRGKGANHLSRTAPYPSPPSHTFHQLLIAGTASALLTLTPPASRAADLPGSSLSTVSAADAVAAAKPLPKPASINKGRVWTLFGLGAAGVFGGALAAERIEWAFPAIAKANRAVADARARAARGDAAVAAGLKEARERMVENGEEGG